jgi:Domain of unknown function (DUF6430)
VDDAPYTEDLDLSVSTPGELAALLRTVHLRADKPSLRALETKTRHEPSPLSKTVVSEMLRGTRFPRKAVMIGFLRACGVPDEQLPPWQRAWERIAELEHGEPGEEPAGSAAVADDEAALRGLIPDDGTGRRQVAGDGTGLSETSGPTAGPAERSRDAAPHRRAEEALPTQARHESQETARANQRPWDGMRGEFGELRQAIERALELPGGGTTDPSLNFESYEIRPGMATFSVVLQPGRQRVLVRVDGRECPLTADRERFGEEVDLAEEISSHLYTSRIIGGDFTSSGYPFVMQLIDSRAVPCEPPLPVTRIMDIGKVLADALDYAHNMGGSFGIIEPSHILLTPEGDPVLTFPHLPMFVPPGDSASAEARDVYGLCAALLSMLPRPQDTRRPAEPGGGALEPQVRELLESGLRAERRLRPSASVLREKFYELAREARDTWASVEVSRRIGIPGKDGSLVAEILVKTGDLFREVPDIVISFSDTFDTDISISGSGRVIISPSSLQGQLLSRIYGGDVDVLDRDLGLALASMPVERRESRDKKVLGKLDRYEIGTVAVLEHSEKRIFAIAVSRMGGNLIARSSYQFLEKSLNKLWGEIRRRDCRSVAMPIIGSGLARVNVSPYSLYDLITSSFREHTQAQPICPQLRIIIHPSDRETVRRIDAALSTQGFPG